ncbi:helix-turn-helix domain-containing protein [Leeuwenhoekiella aequorea]|uniref:helix-turn-helix domain-containing protein n=1 Tax=Leeuwenhoekiella aequorea TaxID=283736 RepID=UPI00352D2BCE|tara:strand:- start:14959 stop:15261 length:303 start_codon:yes stop_codon:yes gene_type:complete
MKKPKIILFTEKGIQEYKLVTSSDQNLLEGETFSSIPDLQTTLKKDKKLYTFPETREIFACSRPTLYNWIRDEILKPIRIGGRIYFRPKDIDELIESQSK